MVSPTSPLDPRSTSVDLTRRRPPKPVDEKTKNAGSEIPKLKTGETKITFTGPDGKKVSPSQATKNSILQLFKNIGPHHRHEFKHSHQRAESKHVQTKPKISHEEHLSRLVKEFTQSHFNPIIALLSDSQDQDSQDQYALIAPESRTIIPMFKLTQPIQNYRVQIGTQAVNRPHSSRQQHNLSREETTLRDNLQTSLSDNNVFIATEEDIQLLLETINNRIHATKKDKSNPNEKKGGAIAAVTSSDDLKREVSSKDRSHKKAMLSSSKKEAHAVEVEKEAHDRTERHKKEAMEMKKEQERKAYKKKAREADEEIRKRNNEI